MALYVTAKILMRKLVLAHLICRSVLFVNDPLLHKYELRKYSHYIIFTFQVHVMHENVPVKFG